MNQRLTGVFICLAILCFLHWTRRGADAQARVTGVTVTQGGVTVLEMGECVDVEVVGRGDNCNNPASMLIRVRNSCDQPMDLRYCIESTEGRGWSCGVFSNAQPWDSDAIVAARETSFFSCSTTGRIFRAARPAGRFDIRLANP